MRYLPPILFFIFICWIIIQADLGAYNPLIVLTKKVPFGDKLGHFLLYGTLVFLVNIASGLHMLKIKGYKILTGALLVMSFAIIEEFTQITLRTRNFEVLDIICDVLGIIVFSILSIYFYRSKAKTLST